MFKICKIINKPSKVYKVYLLENGKFKSVPDYENKSIFKCLDYAYGVGSIKIVSDIGFNVEFNPGDYSKEDVKSAGYLEPFDFLVHNILTQNELNIWKLYIRNEDMF